jgi:hypothetical protein
MQLEKTISEANAEIDNMQNQVKGVVVLLPSAQILC